MTTAPDLDFAPYGIDTLWLDRAPKPRTILIAYPHPDDESFGNGGTIARYVAEGAAVHYACATRGECGTVDAHMLEGYADTAALRTAEQTCAARALGLAAVHFLGHRDSGMPGTADNQHPNAFIQAPLERVAGQLAALIRALRPQVVLTFNSYGGYGHPDHIACYHATQAAFEAAADPARFPEAGPAWAVSKLYEINRPRELTRQAWERMRERGMKTPLDNPDYQLENFTAPDELITTAIDVAEFMGLKRAALLEHRTQIAADGPFLSMPEDIGRSWSGVEYFTLLRARVALPPHDGYEDDLFAGIG